jgi:hypothetical protein
VSVDPCPRLDVSHVRSIDATTTDHSTGGSRRHQPDVRCGSVSPLPTNSTD